MRPNTTRSRVLLDTNVLISYLLTPVHQSPVHYIVQAAVDGEYALILPHDLVNELVEVVKSKAYLAKRISLLDIEEMLSSLGPAVEALPTLSGTIPAATRDPKDDYLLVYALIGQADYLVTGDDDLLSLGEVEDVKIVNPADFAKLLRGSQ